MAINRQYVSDIQSTVLGGLNKGRDPELIGEQQVAGGQNVSLRGGRAHSRPRYIKRASLPTGKLQGGHVFSAINKVIVSVSGGIYEVDTDGWGITEKTTAETRNAVSRPRHWYCETVGSLVIQDGQSKPWIYDGSDFRAARDGTAGADDITEVPVGEAMAYGNGRLAVVVNAGRDVRIGDIHKPEHQSELIFTETYALNDGGDLNFPTKVKALAYLPVIDTGSGQGSLIVGCEDSVSTLKTQVTQRELWGDMSFQTVLFSNRGVTGAHAFAAVNQDLYFRSSDGLRSVRTSTADYDTPGLTPLSVEVRHRLAYDSPWLLEDASVVLFDNRLLITHSPFIYDNRAMYQGLVSVNFDTMSSMGTKASPIFEPEWDGLVIANLTVGRIFGKERCFVIGRDEEGQNSLWEILSESDEPVVTDDEPTQAIETRVLFGESPGNLKHLRRADVTFSDIRGDLDVRVYFRPAKCPWWIPWDTFHATAPEYDIKWGTVFAQFRGPFQTREVPEYTDPQTRRPVSLAHGFQIRVEWEGRARLDYLQVFMEPNLETGYATNVTTDPVLIAAPDYAYLPKFWRSHDISPLAGIE